MASLEKKILYPNLLLMVSIPVVSFIIFNIYITYFSELQTKKDLTFIYEEINFKNHSRLTSQAIVEKLVRTKRFSLATDLFMYMQDGKILDDILYSSNYYGFGEHVGNAAFKALQNKIDGEIFSFVVNSNTYFAVKKSMIIDSKNVVIIYVSNSNMYDNFADFIDNVFLFISFFVVAIAFIFSKKIAHSLVEPIKNIVKTIEQSNFDTPIVVNVTTNVSELKILSDEINSMGKRIYENSQTQKNYFHNASHELRTPLMVIQGYAEGIEKNLFQDNIQAANKISREIHRLTKLVNELLQLSRIENMYNNVVLKKDSLHKVILEQVSFINKFAIKNGKTIKIELVENIYSCINEELFKQVLINIIENGIKHTKKYIEVRLSATETHAIIEIEDDGNGISAQDLPYIFDKFYRGEKGNFGLGLSICKSATEAMGGTIYAKNGEKGAFFTIQLPLYK